MLRAFYESQLETNLKCGIMHPIWFIQPWEKKQQQKKQQQKKPSEFPLLVIIHYNR